MPSRRTPRALRPEPIVDERELHAALDRVRYRTAIAEWLGDAEWSHFISLTTDPPMRTTDRLWPRIAEFTRAAGRAAHRRVPWIAVLEEHAHEGFHAHLLIEGTEHLTVAALERLWPAGYCHVEVFDRAKGDAARYVTKYLTAVDDDTWRISRRAFRRAARCEVNRLARQILRRIGGRA